MVGGWLGLVLSQGKVGESLTTFIPNNVNNVDVIVLCVCMFVCCLEVAVSMLYGVERREKKKEEK